MESRTLDSDPIMGITRIHHYDPATDQSHIETRQDVTELTELTKHAFNSKDERANWKGDVHHVASIPMTVFMELKRKGIVDDEAAFKRWLNDRDNRVFRTRPGVV